MEILKDLYYTNRSILKSTADSILKNWPIIFTGIFYTIATIFLYSIVRFFGILAGLVLIVATSALISNYLHLLDGIISRNRITLQDFKEGFGIHLRKVWSLLFIFWVAEMGYSLLLDPILSRVLDSRGIDLIIMFLTIAVLNPIPEILYQKHYTAWESIIYSFEFIKDNWLEWFIPNAIFLGALFLLTGTTLRGVLNYYLPINLLFSRGGIVIYLIAQVIFSFMMVYRGYLFETLSTSNRRKRLFMRRF